MDDFFIKKRAKEEGEKAGGKKKQREITKNLLKMGMDVSKVIEATGIEKKEIEKLVNKIKKN